jgi:steroid delta-isomerase-like uncharacterized protein
MSSMIVIVSVVLASCARVNDGSENKAIVRGYMEEIVNEGDFAAWDAYFSEKVVFNNTEITKQDLKGILDSFRSGFPDFRITVEDQIGEGDKVVTRVMLRGTHRGEISGIAPTGKEVQYAGIAIDRIADGKVVEMWHVSDDWGMLRQLGIAANVK